METPPTPSPAGGLILASVNARGRALGLAPGDQLLLIDGESFDGQTATLMARFGRGLSARRALWFRRDDRDWPVLCDTPILGRWRGAPGAGPLPEDPAPPQGLRNWEVLSGPGNSYDVQPVQPPLLALIPPLHLVQMRLWPALAIWAALSVLGLPLGWVAGSALQGLLCLYFWRAAPVLVRSDRFARGFRLWRIVAARSEADLHRRMTRLAPDLHFALARKAPQRPTPAAE